MQPCAIHSEVALQHRTRKDAKQTKSTKKSTPRDFNKKKIEAKEIILYGVPEVVGASVR